ARRCGVFIGTGMGGITSFAANESNQILTAISAAVPEVSTKAGSLVRMPARFNPFAVPMVMPNASAASIAIKLGILGENRTTCHACAAGAFALGQALNAIQTGSIDTAIAGGAEYLTDDFGGIFRAFDMARTLVRKCDPAEKANRPFDRSRSGFLF